MRCPIQCGQCCELWRDVFPDAPEELIQCPHLGPQGCSLQRKVRPDPCTDYLCEIAQEVVGERITLNQGVTHKENCLWELPKEGG